jgi:hypothetical protein
MAVGFNAHWHPLPMHINTPYSTFNDTKWLNSWGMGWAWAGWWSAMLLAVMMTAIAI